MEVDLNKNIEELDLVFLDLETTGLDFVMGDAICEIGAYKTRSGKVVDKFHSLVNPKRSIPKEAYRIHKISDEQVKYAPFFEKIADKLISFVEGSVVCAYNVSFDMGFVDNHLKVMGRDALTIPAIDALSMARDVLELNRYNLASVAQSLDVDCSGGLHRALDDALITYRVFFKLMDIFKEKNIVRLSDFLSLYGFGNDIVKLKEIQKSRIISEAIEKENALRIRYFSSKGRVDVETVVPLRILQENRYFSFLYQGSEGSPSRIRSNRILDIEIHGKDN
jgi:DNA polymerase III epsilon subunit family exonuclease